jgi:hypothetical protein
MYNGAVYIGRRMALLLIITSQEEALPDLFGEH